VATLSLSAVDRSIRVKCQDTEAQALLEANYGSMRGNRGAPDLNYAVGRQKRSSAFFIMREGRTTLRASCDGELLYLLDKDITIELQKLRRDLYFVHAAVLEFAGKAVMLVGTNKSGKSTTAWALLQQGFYYLSDELGPVDLKTLEVYPYPRALWLRRELPGSHLPSENIVHTSWTLYVPTEFLPTRDSVSPLPLGAIFFVCYRPEISRPAVRPISKAEGGARLFANALNPLAHPGGGLDSAIEIVRRSACFELITADLPATCALVKATLKGLSNGYGETELYDAADDLASPGCLPG